MCTLSPQTFARTMFGTTSRISRACYETKFEAAAERKAEKYEKLVTGACDAGYTYETELITLRLEVGSRRQP